MSDVGDLLEDVQMTAIPTILIYTHSIHTPMERKNITIREDQSDWVQQRGVNLSQFVQQQLDEAMGPSDDDLAQAYRENAENARQMNAEWSDVSTEANQYLGANPLEDDS